MELEGLLNKLNKEYLQLHETYEDLFWEGHMGDTSMNEPMDRAKHKLETWRSNAELMQELQNAIDASNDEKLIQR
jgi:hypothetical protein